MIWVTATWSATACAVSVKGLSSHDQLAQLESNVIYHVLSQIDAESTAETAKAEDEGGGLGFLPFFLGTVLIPFSLALLWKNEKKLVNFVRMLEIARKEC